TWLLLSQPWLDGNSDLDPPAAAAAAPRFTPSPPAASAPADSFPAGDQGARADLETPLEHNPLRMAELAYEAGMLVEPEEYSAWTLYKRAVEQDPDSDAARSGLEKIANELLKRASVAVEQGRFDDALATIQRVRSAIPAHPGANDLAFRIEALRPAPEPVEQARAEPEPEPEPAPAQASAAPAEAPAPPPAREEPAVDPILDPHARFGEALAASRLLT